MPDGPGSETVDHPPAKEQLARDGEAAALQPLTLASMCLCGHARRSHRGLRMEATGPCLECGCQEFSRARAASQPRDQMMKTIRMALEQVRRARELVSSLRALLSNVD
jgi:hypothetical protein